jgi:hypothetical protein
LAATPVKRLASAAISEAALRRLRYVSEQALMAAAAPNIERLAKHLGWLEAGPAMAAV